MKQSCFYAVMISAACALWTDSATALVDGELDFRHRAVGTLLVLEPGHPRGDWGAFCSAFLIHNRVLLTAGHCVQQTQALLAAGVFLDARISLQQNPFDPRTYVEGDPDASGWYAINELVDNPDNPDWLNIDEISANWGNWHDLGAIILRKRVKGVRPLRVPRFPGHVEFLFKLQCQWQPDVDGFCEPLLVAYGLQDWPPSFTPNFRQSVNTNFVSVDPLFVHTQRDPGGNCFGDSGGALLMNSQFKRLELAVAILSSPADNPFTPPLVPPCTGENIQYRLDTKSALRFIRSVLNRVRFERGYGPFSQQWGAAENTDSSLK